MRCLSFTRKIEALARPVVRGSTCYLVNYEGMAGTILDDQRAVLRPRRGEADPRRRGRRVADRCDPRRDQRGPFTDIAQSLQAGFADAGINLEILPGIKSRVITRYRDRSHEATLLPAGPDFMDPHSNAKAFAYNADNSDANDTATTTRRNGWAVPEALDEFTTAAPTAPDGEMHHGLLQREVQAESAFIIMFQASCQAATDEAVTGNVNGAKSDLVHYRLIDK